MLQITLKDGRGYYIAFESAGIISNKIPKKWAAVGSKLQFILESRLSNEDRTRIGLTCPTGPYAVEQTGDNFKITVGVIIGALIICFGVFLLVGTDSDGNRLSSNVRSYLFITSMFAILALVSIWATVKSIQNLRCVKKEYHSVGKLIRAWVPLIFSVMIAVGALGFIVFAVMHAPV